MFRISREAVLASCAVFVLLAAGDRSLARTTSAEPASRLDEARVEDGVWIVPELGVRLPAIEGWIPREVAGCPALCAPPARLSSDRIALSITSSSSEDLETLRATLAFNARMNEVVYEELSLVKVGGADALLARRRGLTKKSDRRVTTLRVPRGKELLLITATVDAERSTELGPRIEESLTGLRFDSDSGTSIATTGKLERLSTVEQYVPLRLPVAEHAIADERKPDDYPAVINVRADGGIVALHEYLLDLPPTDSLDEGSRQALMNWLYGTAQRMKKGEVGGSFVPMEDLLIRAEASAPFCFVQKIMASCGYQDIQLWKIDLAAACEPDGVRTDSRESRGTEGVFHAYLPTDVELLRDQQKVEVLIEVKVKGKALDPKTNEPWNGDPGTSFVYGDGRRLAYTIAGRSTGELKHVSDFLKRFGEAEGEWSVTIDARKGVTYGEVIAVMDAALGAGIPGVTFVGSYE